MNFSAASSLVRRGQVAQPGPGALVTTRFHDSSGVVLAERPKPNARTVEHRVVDPAALGLARVVGQQRADPRVAQLAAMGQPLAEGALEGEAELPGQPAATPSYRRWRARSPWPGSSRGSPQSRSMRSACSMRPVPRHPRMRPIRQLRAAARPRCAGRCGRRTCPPPRPRSPTPCRTPRPPARSRG